MIESEEIAQSQLRSVSEPTVGPFREVRCPRCESGVLTVRSCKAICETCGYVESCEDNFVPTRRNPSTGR